MNPENDRIIRVRKIPDTNLTVEQVYHKQCNVCPFCGSSLIQMQVIHAYSSCGLGKFDGNIKYNLYECMNCGAIWTGEISNEDEYRENDE